HRVDRWQLRRHLSGVVAHRRTVLSGRDEQRRRPENRPAARRTADPGAHVHARRDAYRPAVVPAAGANGRPRTHVRPPGSRLHAACQTGDGVTDQAIRFCHCCQIVSAAMTPKSSVAHTMMPNRYERMRTAAGSSRRLMMMSRAEYTHIMKPPTEAEITRSTSGCATPNVRIAQPMATRPQ